MKKKRKIVENKRPKQFSALKPFETFISKKNLKFYKTIIFSK